MAAIKKMWSWISTLGRHSVIFLYFAARKPYVIEFLILHVGRLEKFDKFGHGHKSSHRL